MSALEPLIRRKLQDERLALQERLHKTILFVRHVNPNTVFKDCVTHTAQQQLAAESSAAGRHAGCGVL